MPDGYRWVDAAGEPCSPRHGTIDTAARWLARQPQQPRIRPRPVALLAERGRVGHYTRRRVLDADERERLVDVASDAPPSARAWLDRTTMAAKNRRRRRASLGRITGRLAATHDTRRQSA